MIDLTHFNFRTLAAMMPGWTWSVGVGASKVSTFSVVGMCLQAPISQGQ